MLPIVREEKKALPPQAPKRKVKDEEGSIRFEFEGNKIHFISLGCPRNLVDSEVMLGILLKAGYEVATS